MEAVSRDSQKTDMETSLMLYLGASVPSTKGICIIPLYKIWMTI